MYHSIWKIIQSEDQFIRLLLNLNVSCQKLDKYKKKLF